MVRGYQKCSGSCEEMEKKRCEVGFQEARGEKGGRKGETNSRQTSEGKQKLMKQDVASDGSLHTSKHGTLGLASTGPPSLPPPSSPHGETENRIIPRSVCCSHGTVNHHSDS